MTFLAWLRKQVKRDDEVGDLARDTFRLKKHPFNGDFRTWRQYLADHGACSEAQDALKVAWKEYRVTLRP